MVCPNCGEKLTIQDHHTQWDEKSDGMMYDHNHYDCPKCGTRVHDHEDAYVWMPDECYPENPYK